VLIFHFSVVKIVFIGGDTGLHSYFLLTIYYSVLFMIKKKFSYFILWLPSKLRWIQLHLRANLILESMLRLMSSMQPHLTLRN